MTRHVAARLGKLNRVEVCPILTRKLKIDSRFTPCSIEDGDELFPNGIFVFNITKMTEYITNHEIPCEEVQVKDFSRGASKFKALQGFPWVTG